MMMYVSEVLKRFQLASRRINLIFKQRNRTEQKAVTVEFFQYLVITVIHHNLIYKISWNICDINSTKCINMCTFRRIVLYTIKHRFVYTLLLRNAGNLMIYTLKCLADSCKKVSSNQSPILTTKQSKSTHHIGLWKFYCFSFQPWLCYNKNKLKWEEAGYNNSILFDPRPATSHTAIHTNNFYKNE